MTSFRASTRNLAFNGFRHFGFMSENYFWDYIAAACKQCLRFGWMLNQQTVSQ